MKIGFPQIKVVHSFEYAHHLLLHPGKCKNLHGHSAQVVMTIQFDKLPKNPEGILVDFGTLKEILKEVIDRRYDHSTIVAVDDPLYWILLGRSKIATLDLEMKASSAENIIQMIASDLAEEMLERLGREVMDNIKSFILELYEGPNSSVSIAVVIE